jgi:hypothetical protein
MYFVGLPVFCVSQWEGLFEGKDEERMRKGWERVTYLRDREFRCYERS